MAEKLPIITDIRRDNTVLHALQKLLTDNAWIIFRQIMKGKQ